MHRFWVFDGKRMFLGIEQAIELFIESYGRKSLSLMRDVLSNPTLFEVNY